MSPFKFFIVKLEKLERNGPLLIKLSNLKLSIIN